MGFLSFVSETRSAAERQLLKAMAERHSQASYTGPPVSLGTLQVIVTGQTDYYRT